MKLKYNNNIFCSVSAGYSSVMMASKMKDWYPNHNIVFGMANTSKEREESLSFMQEASDYFDLNMVWIESVIHLDKGKGAEYKIVQYEDLKRSGEIFEQGIKKYGIPNSENKWCNRELKLIPLKKFCDDIFGMNNYSIAVGLRVDEIDRVRADYKDNNVFYPLIDHKISSRDRNRFWKDHKLNLGIPAYKGNCDLCFEKSNRKLLTIIKEEPHLVEWWDRMIKDYGTIELDGKPSYNDLMKETGTQTFYRKYRTIEDLVEMAKHPFRKASDEYIYESDLFDLEDECGSSCSAF